jgi:4-amino-4-deoxy-L-arabinose transferase-like glycosyltransferase
MATLRDKYIWILLIVSLLVRVYLSFFTYVIQNDSAAFMQNAEYFANGDFLSGLKHAYHPLYSLLMAGLYKAVPDMELSGTIISILLGTLTVIIFYLIGKSIFDQKISFVSSAILAFHPYAVRFSADIISESTYFFFFISAIGLGFFAITNRKLLLFALTGICSALAYLTRPEGIGILFIVAGWCLLNDLAKIKVVWKEKAISILVLIVSFLVFSLPYLVFIKKETGYWHLTMKKSLSQMIGVKETLSGQENVEPVEENADRKKSSDANISKQTYASRTDLSTHLKSILYIMKKYLETLHPLLFIFLIIGVVNWSRMKKERFFGLYIASIIAVYLFILYRLNLTYLTHGYPSRRHLMPLVIPATFCVGIGVHTTGTWMHEKLQHNSLTVGFKEFLRSTWTMQLIVLMIVVSALLPKTLKPQRFDKLGIKKVGQWIKENSNKPYPAILSVSARNAYYAKGKHIQMESINNALVMARERKVDYIFISHREYKAIEEELLQSIKDKEITLAHKYPEKESLNRRSILLYKVLQ